MKSAAILSKPAKPELVTIVPPLIAWLKDRDYSVVYDRETALYLSSDDGLPREQIAAHGPEFAIVLGGDGTLLSAARALAPSGVPILPVNLGSLGFLTEVPLDGMYSTLERVLTCRCPAEERSVLRCQLVRKGEVVAVQNALNDVVVNKSAIARLMGFDLYIDETYVFGYKADGVIISTPTGSTAYSLAAGGPVLMPSVAGFVVTPVCPHSLTHRPVVVPDNSQITVVAQSSGEEAFLTIDGQLGQPLQYGDRVVCSKSPHTVKLLRMEQAFFQVLRNKLKWGER